MTRDTSIEAYRSICASGALSKMKRMAYHILYTHGPLTANQVMAKFKEENPNAKHQTMESVGRVLSFLVEDGIAKELGKIECPISKMTITQWDVTSSSLKNLSRAEKLDKQILKLEKRCAILKAKRALILNQRISDCVN